MKTIEEITKLDLAMAEYCVDLPGYAIYKCRAECYKDVHKFIKMIYKHLKEWKCKPWYFDSATLPDSVLMPDIDFTFVCNLNISLMKIILDSLDDCHVMSDTLQPLEKYTGER